MSDVADIPMLPWIQTMRGAQCWPQDPDPAVFELGELATVLARLPRFAGHTCRPYSVAEHSILVASLVPPGLKLPGLMHDAAEAYSGFGDVSAPVKRLFPGIRQIEKRITRALGERFGFDPEHCNHPAVRQADLVALAVEKRELMAPEPDRWIDLPESSAVSLPLILDPAEQFIELFHEFQVMGV